MAPDGRALYVAGNDDQDVVPVDIATRVPGRPILVRQYLMGLAVTRNGRTVYTADGDSNMVSVVALR